MKNTSIPTLDDVATKANVSTATVSRCLNSPEQVVDETRVRVLAAVRELGYYPNFGARVLAAKRTNTIGAVIPTMDNAVFARGIQAFQEALRDQGVTLLIASSSYQEDIEAEQIRTLTARGADGLLLIGHHRDEEIYRFLHRRGVPALTIWAYDKMQSRPSIGFSNRQAMKALAEKVISMGHRSIGVISAEQETNDRVRERVNGIREAMTESGLSPDALQLIETPYSIMNGNHAFSKLMSRAEKPTVVMCVNDVLAIGALKAAHSLGISVPNEISITGFDDIELASVADPELTTVHVPHREMGKLAARTLVDMVNGTPLTESVELMTRLCIRGSLAAPK